MPTAQIARSPAVTPAPSATPAPPATATAALPSPTLRAPTATLLPSVTPTVTVAAAVDPTSAFERQVYALINQLRAAHGVAPLAYNTLLAQAARAHSCEQAANSAISHTSGDGRTLAQRLPPVDPPWEWPSENIAAGFATPEELVRAWFDEQPPDDWHRRNILSGDQRELGVGFCAGASGAPGYSNVVTADFARRVNLFPIVLNGGAATTDSATIGYWLYGAGWADAVRLGAMPDLGALPWQPFAPEGSYALSPAG
ncbi:MAG: CAP domain-containing protein, partial [Chloroflexales bacterium]|nr:CAP domain-containing protein [Chloroflexales bacterium]